MTYYPSNLICQPSHCPLCHSPRATQAGTAADPTQALELCQACDLCRSPLDMTLGHVLSLSVP